MGERLAAGLIGLTTGFITYAFSALAEDLEAGWRIGIALVAACLAAFGAATLARRLKPTRHTQILSRIRGNKGVEISGVRVRGGVRTSDSDVVSDIRSRGEVSIRDVHVDGGTE